MHNYFALSEEDSLDQARLLELQASLQQVINIVQQSNAGYVEPKIIFHKLEGQALRRQVIERAIQLGLDKGLLDLTTEFAISAPNRRSVPAVHMDNA